MVLINLIAKKINEYLKTEKFPNQMICVLKDDILDIQRLFCRYELSGINLTCSTRTINLSKLETLCKLYIKMYINFY